LSEDFTTTLCEDFTTTLSEDFTTTLSEDFTTTLSEDFTTTFHLILEPLLLGFLPQTAVPTLLLIILFSLGSALTVPTIIRFIERAAQASSSSNEKTE